MTSWCEHALRTAGPYVTDEFSSHRVPQYGVFVFRCCKFDQAFEQNVEISMILRRLEDHVASQQWAGNEQNILTPRHHYAVTDIWGIKHLLPYDIL